MKYKSYPVNNAGVPVTYQLDLTSGYKRFPLHDSLFIMIISLIDHQIVIKSYYLVKF